MQGECFALDTKENLRYSVGVDCCKIFISGFSMMRSSIHIILFLTVFFLAGVSGVHASVSHDHHEKLSPSPFNVKNVKSENQSLHCPLNKHRHGNRACPHFHVRDHKKETRIAVDCGGNPDGAVPAPPSLSKSHFLFLVDFILPTLRDAENIFVSSYVFQHVPSDRIEHPPRP